MCIYPSPPAFHQIHGGVQKSKKLRRTALCILSLYLITGDFYVCPQAPAFPPAFLSIVHIVPQKHSEYRSGLVASPPTYPAASKVAQW